MGNNADKIGKQNTNFKTIQNQFQASNSSQQNNNLNSIVPQTKMQNSMNPQTDLISEELCTKLFNSIVNISQNHESKNGTGFLIKIKINNQTFKYLITCIDEDIKEKK